MTENTSSMPASDPLDTNVNDIDTSYPVLPATHYMLKIEGAKRETSKDNQGGTLSSPYTPTNDGERLTIPFRTVEKVQDKKGNDVIPGHQITHYIGITEKRNIPGKEDYLFDSIKKSVARVAKAAGVNATVRQIIENPAILDGKIVQAKVKVNKETDEYPEGNSISGFADKS